MPRPDLKLISVEYRRIPVVAIGRDAYLDTRLQLPKLESLDVSLPRLVGATPERRALERLLSAYVSDRGVFGTMALPLPGDLPLMKDPNFVGDRDDFFASPDYRWDPQSRKDRRPASLQKMVDMFTLFDETLLADGRPWVLGTPQPSLADIEAVWLPNFILEIPGALPEEQFNAGVYPHILRGSTGSAPPWTRPRQKQTAQLVG